MLSFTTDFDARYDNRESKWVYTPKGSWDGHAAFTTNGKTFQTADEIIKFLDDENSSADTFNENLPYREAVVVEIDEDGELVSKEGIRYYGYEPYTAQERRDLGRTIWETKS